MDNLSGYAHRPLPFVLRYLRQRLASHLVIVISVVAAVACSVGTQYGVKYLVDGLSAGPSRAGTVWLAFVFLMSLIAADNFLWRIARWAASFTFLWVNRELTARGRSLRYLEKLRITHAAITVVLTIALLAWAIVLWQHGSATTGDVVLVCTLGLSILSATRDLAVALVDTTQHFARLTEAIATLLLPHELRDHPQAEPLVKSGAAIAFSNISFQYPGGVQVFDKFSLRIQPGQRVGLVGQSGGGKSSLFVLLQRFYDVQQGSITIDGQDISRVTQQSLRQAISVVPHDISLFHRSILENIRYGRPNATDDEVLRAAIASRCH